MTQKYVYVRFGHRRSVRSLDWVEWGETLEIPQEGRVTQHITCPICGARIKVVIKSIRSTVRGNYQDGFLCSVLFIGAVFALLYIHWIAWILIAIFGCLGVWSFTKAINKNPQVGDIVLICYKNPKEAELEAHTIINEDDYFNKAKPEA